MQRHPVDKLIDVASVLLSCFRLRHLVTVMAMVAWGAVIGVLDVRQVQGMSTDRSSIRRTPSLRGLQWDMDCCRNGPQALFENATPKSAFAGPKAVLGVSGMLATSTRLIHFQRRSQATRVNGYSLLNLPGAQLALSKLASTVSFSWSGRELRTGLQELSRTFSVSMWLDRRLDPSTLINFQVDMQSVSLWEALNQIAEQANAKAVLIENVVYIGPADVADRVARSAAMLHAELSQRSGGEAVGRRFSWQELATSNEILANIKSQWGIQIEGELPHDLYHAGELPTPCTLTTQLVLLVSGFELEVEQIAMNQLRLKKLGDSKSWTGNYPKSALNGNAARRTSIVNLRRQYPGSKYTEANGSVTLQGPAHFHIAMLMPKGTKQRNAPSDILRQRWGFEVANHSAEMVIGYLAKQIGFRLEWSPDCEPKAKQQIITLKVDQASLDDILTAFSESSQFRATRSGLTVKIQPK